jgi:flagellar biosynthesis GTPase FlhF
MSYLQELVEYSNYELQCNILTEDLMMLYEGQKWDAFKKYGKHAINTAVLAGSLAGGGMGLGGPQQLQGAPNNNHTVASAQQQESLPALQKQAQELNAQDQKLSALIEKLKKKLVDVNIGRSTREKYKKLYNKKLEELREVLIKKEEVREKLQQHQNNAKHNTELSKAEKDMQGAGQLSNLNLSPLTKAINSLPR